MIHLIFCIFLFLLGASFGSFLNVVVWRLPRGGLSSLASPPSHCPECEHRLAWRDNIPVFGWIFLKGRCRYCAQPISARYPIVEAVTGALFVFYYLMFFVYHVSPCAPAPTGKLDIFGRIIYEPRLMTGIFQDWPIFSLYLFLVWCLLAVSLIDAELFEIPLIIPWAMAAVGIVVHTLIDSPLVPGALNLTDPMGISAGLAAGGAVGLILSIALYQKGIIPEAFADGEPGLEVDELAYAAAVSAAKDQGHEPPQRPTTRDYTKSEIRGEIRKEIMFLLPPLLCSLVAAWATQSLPGLRGAWRGVLQYHWLTGLMGAALGAMVGALVVWLARILGTLAFGRVAMGLGDVHLMFGVGAIIGGGAATVAFFLAPFMGLLVGLYMLIFRKRHELPYGPYLSLATGAVILFYCPISEYLQPGIQGLLQMVQGLVGA